MGLSLSDLREAMAPLSKVGKGELTFDVTGTVITLRALTPDEEIEVQRYARSAIAEGDLTDQVGALEYLDRFRNASLGYSIVQVGNLDFRDLETIETGEVLPGGTRVKVKRHEAIQQLVGGWSRNMVVAVFKKFGELMNRVEKEVEDLIAFDPVDYDAEITRLEERLRELREEKARMVASETDARTNLRNQVASATTSFRSSAGKAQVSGGDSVQEQTKTSQETITVAIPSDIGREVVSEDEGPDDEETPVAAPVTASGARTSVFDREPGRMPPPAPAASPAPQEEPLASQESPEDSSEIHSSLVDMNDPEAAEKAVEAENRRLMEMRARRVPPHMAAKQVASQVDLSKSPAPEPGPRLTGKRDGMEVYQMPTQVLTDRGRGTPPATTATVATPPKGNVNPRFKPSR